MWALRLVMVGMFGVLLARLWFLQMLQAEEYEKAARLNRIRLVPTKAPRGVIYDLRGEILATNRTAYHLAVMPRGMPEPGMEVKRLQQLVDFTPEERAALERTVRDHSLPPFRSVPVKKDLDIGTITRVEEELVTLPGILIESTPQRVYPQGTLAAHIIGYVGEINAAELEERREKGYRPGDLIGKCGIERRYDEVLRGRSGGQWVEVNARGDPIQFLGTKPMTPGGSITLTLDLRLQRVAEEALQGKVGAVVALDPRNGAVRVMASSPTFDPNLFIPRAAPQTWRELIANPHHPLMNRAIQNQYPPGSAFKLVTAAAGLTEGVITPNTSVYCPGVYHLGSWAFGCWSRHARVDVLQGLGQSCDCFFYETGKRLGGTKLQTYARDFGLGEPTGIDLPFERGGRIPDEAWMQRRHGRPWYGGDNLNLAIGQGDVQVTPLQMALVTSVIANGGKLYVPQLVKRAVDGEGRILYEFQPKLRREVKISPQALRLVREGMREAVYGRGGTGRRVRLPGLEIAGKTGSAQDPPREETHAWFVSFAPYRHPTLAVCVFIEQGGHGGEAAAPIARKIYAAAFGIALPEEALPPGEIPTD